MAMPKLWQNLAATYNSFFQIGGKTGIRWKANGTLFEARDSADAAFVIVRGATPVGVSDLTTKAYVDGITGGAWTPATQTTAAFNFAAAGGKVRVDPTAQAIVGTLPTAPADGTEFVIDVVSTPTNGAANIAGNACAFGVSYAAGGADVIEQYNGAPAATLVLTPGSGTVPLIGYCITLTYDAANAIFRQTA